MGFFNMNGSSSSSSDGITQEQLDLKEMQGIMNLFRMN